MQATVCGKIKDASLCVALDVTASLMAKIERIYFRERFVKRGDRNELKRAFLKKYGITGRQLNGVIFNLSGKVESNKQALMRNPDIKKQKLDTVVSRMLECARKLRSCSRQAINSTRGVPLSTVAGPSPSGGSQQHCSAGVCECFTMLAPFEGSIYKTHTFRNGFNLDRTESR